MSICSDRGPGQIQRTQQHCLRVSRRLGPWLFPDGAQLGLFASGLYVVTEPTLHPGRCAPAQVGQLGSNALLLLSLSRSPGRSFAERSAAMHCCQLLSKRMSQSSSKTLPKLAVLVGLRSLVQKCHASGAARAEGSPALTLDMLPENYTGAAGARVFLFACTNSSTFQRSMALLDPMHETWHGMARHGTAWHRRVWSGAV